MSSDNSPLITISPPTESLLYSDKRWIWDEKIRCNSHLSACANERIKLKEQLESIFNKIPVSQDITLAHDHGLIEDEELTDLFVSLSYFLDQEEGNEVLALYLPFELIPRVSWQPLSTRLKDEAVSFTECYLRAWIKLMSRKDPRADFADGDIPEFEIRTGPLPEVVKAAHLVFILIEKEIVPPPAEAMPETNEILERSVREGLRALKKSKIKEKKVEENRDAGWLSIAFSEIKTELESPPRGIEASIPEARAKWLSQKQVESLTQKHSVTIAEALLADTASFLELGAWALHYRRYEIRMVAIEAGRNAICEMAKTDIEKAKSAYKQFENFMDINLPRKELLRNLKTAWLHFHTLGIVGADALKLRGFEMPRFIEDAILNGKKMEAIVRVIQTNESLQDFLPVVIACGSKTKGYGDETSDDDFAVFIRPGVDFGLRNELLKRLAKVLAEIGVFEKPMEFWLSRLGTRLWIRDFPGLDRNLGDSTLCSILWNGIWSGEKATIEMLYQDLLSDYLFSKGRLLLGEKARKIWLREMEQAALQYRLLHSGYHRFYPEARAPYVPDCNAVDSQSAFWDSGFRRVASMIFIKKVFLPQL